MSKSPNDYKPCCGSAYMPGWVGAYPFNGDKIATEKTCAAPWNGGKNGMWFKCALCGHKFKPGDYYRLVYTNDRKECPGNPIVCEACDGPDVIDKWAAKWEEYRGLKKKFWWFFKGEEK